MLFVRRKSSSHFTLRTAEASNLLGTTTDKVLWIEHRIDFIPYGLEEFGFLDTLDKIVLSYKAEVSAIFSACYYATTTYLLPFSPRRKLGDLGLESPREHLDATCLMQLAS
jgi:hypothetical protein